MKKRTVKRDMKLIHDDRLINEYNNKYKIYTDIQSMITTDNRTSFDKEQLKEARHKIIQELQPYHSELNKRGIPHDF